MKFDGVILIRRDDLDSNATDMGMTLTDDIELLLCDAVFLLT